MSNRVCHICETVVGAKDYCPICTEMVSTLPDPHTMTPEQRVEEWDMWEGILEIDFDLMWGRLELLAGRPIWIQEFAYGWQGLREEVRKNTGNNLVSYDEAVSRMMDAMPEDLKAKTIVVEETEEGEIISTPFEDWNTDLPDAFK